MILDAGDAFSDVPVLPPERLANAIATAELLVDHFNGDGLAAGTLGDKDLALGREALDALAKRAKYPFVTTNLIDADTRQPLFKEYAVVPVSKDGKTVKLGIFGLLSPRGQAQTIPTKLEILPPVEAMKAALPKARAEGAEIFIVLSQLSERDEAAVGEALPEVQLFLGGDGLGMTADAKVAGKALSYAGSQKGKHLGLVTLTLEDPAGAGAPLFDPGRKKALERKREEADRRIKMYERLIGEAAKPPEEPVRTAPDGTAPVPKPRANVPVEAYQRQLAGARADLSLAETELGALPPEDANAKRNGILVELVPLSRDVEDDPVVKAKVDEFRKTWPDLTPGH